MNLLLIFESRAEEIVFVYILLLRLVELLGLDLNFLLESFDLLKPLNLQFFFH